MTRIINFADGFTSASAPDVEGTSLESYDILNNTTGTLFTVLPAETTSIFASYELSRSTYVQGGSFVAVYDSGWTIQQGNYIGDDLIQDTISNPQEIRLYFSGNDLKYDSGNIGSNGKLKLSITRVTA